MKVNLKLLVIFQLAALSVLSFAQVGWQVQYKKNGTSVQTTSGTGYSSVSYLNWYLGSTPTWDSNGNGDGYAIGPEAPPNGLVLEQHPQMSGCR